MAAVTTSQYSQAHQLRRWNRNLTKTVDYTYARLSEALYYEGEAVMQDAKENYVPVKWGVLRSSGFVRAPRIEGTKLVVELGFGSAAAWYAIIVHERPMVHPERWSKTYSGRRGQNKYLEKPMNKRARGFDVRMAKWMIFLKQRDMSL